MSGTERAAIEAGTWSRALSEAETFLDVVTRARLLYDSMRDVYIWGSPRRSHRSRPGARARTSHVAITTAHRALVLECFPPSGRARATSAQEFALLVGGLAKSATGGVWVELACSAPVPDCVEYPQPAESS